MTEVLTANVASKSRGAVPGYVRITHWLNVPAIVIMAMSGMRIYDASPIFAFSIPHSITLGGWLGGALLWHFAVMWLLVVNGLVYLTLNVATGRMRKRLLSISIAGLCDDIAKLLRGNLSHSSVDGYNSIQKLAYASVIAALGILVISGLTIWKPVQLSFLCALLGGFDNARIVHFAAMTFTFGFVIVHLVMVVVVPRTLLLITRGH